MVTLQVGGGRLAKFGGIRVRGIMKFRKAFAALIGVALIGGAFTTVLPATAEASTYDSWIEEGDPTPFTTVDGLVFYKAASINYGKSDGNGGLTPLTALADVSGLAYTIKDSTGYAPSYQIGIMGGSMNVTYARWVWEPYQQDVSPGDDKGTYSQIENGRWWAATVWIVNPDPADTDHPTVKRTPFDGGVDGSQAKPQPLSFFEDYFGSDTTVAFFGIKQGTTTVVTSTLTHLEFGGENVALGDVDATPYSSADITAATEPLQSELSKVKDELDQTKSALDAAASTSTATQAMVTAMQNRLNREQAHRGVISGTVKAGKKVTAALVHPVPGATMTYQWYVNGKKVAQATKATLKLKRSFAGKRIAVKITTSWIDAAAVSHRATTTAKYRRTAYIKG